MQLPLGEGHQLFLFDEHIVNFGSPCLAPTVYYWFNSAFEFLQIRKDKNFAKLSAVDTFVLNISFSHILYAGGIAVSLLGSRGNLFRSVTATNVSLFCGIIGGSVSLLLLLGLAFTRYKYIIDRYQKQCVRRLACSLTECAKSPRLELL